MTHSTSLSIKPEAVKNLTRWANTSTIEVMRKAFLFFLILIASLLLLAPGGTLAQESSGISESVARILPPQPPDTFPGLLGQNHAYSVTLRGNGEAVIASRVTFTNTGDDELAKLSFRVPRVEPKDALAFQVIQEARCIRYKPVPQELLRSGQPYTPECQEYHEPDYFQYWYGNAKYQKAETDLSTDTIIIKLPNAVKSNGSGSLLLYFRAFGYAKKNVLGVYNFTFETLKVEDRIRELTVGITVDDDLHLAGAKGKVQYRIDESAGMAMKEMTLSAPAASPQLDSYYQQIGGGEIVKKASNLQPLDSYTVKGKFAESRLALYVQPILVWGLVGLVLLTLMLFSAVKSVQFIARTLDKSQVDQKNTQGNITPDVVGVFTLSFAAGFLIISYTVLLLLGRNLLGSYYNYEYQFLFAILTVIISLGVFGFLTLSPALIMGVRRGLLWGLATFGMTIAWLVIDAIIALVIVSVLSRYTQTSIMPMMESIKRTAPAGSANLDSSVQLTTPPESVLPDSIQE